MIHLSLLAAAVAGTMLFAARFPHAVHVFHMALRGIIG